MTRVQCIIFEYRILIMIGITSTMYGTCDENVKSLIVPFIEKAAKSFPHSLSSDQRYLRI